MTDDDRPTRRQRRIRPGTASTDEPDPGGGGALHDGPRRRLPSEPDLREIEERQLATFEEPLGPFPGGGR